MSGQKPGFEVATSVGLIPGYSEGGEKHAPSARKMPEAYSYECAAAAIILSTIAGCRGVANSHPMMTPSTLTIFA